MRKREVTSRAVDGIYMPFGNGNQKWILFAGLGINAPPIIYLGYCKDPVGGVTFYYAQKKTDR